MGIARNSQVYVRVVRNCVRRRRRAKKRERGY